MPTTIDIEAVAPDTQPHLSESATRMAQAEAVRAQATQLLAEKKYVEARKALQEAQRLESAAKWKSKASDLFSSIRSRFPDSKQKQATDSPAEVPQVQGRLASAKKVVSLYSKIAAGAGIVPGGLLNLAAILTVQVVMVWRIANIYGNKANKERIRGLIMSLIGSVIPTTLGHGAAVAVASIPAAIAGTALYFVATPLLAYALTRAVGNTFIMHFESGVTLLTFDPKAFADHFAKEFRNAGGMAPGQTAPSAMAGAQPL
jgi:uncharacterized protein (DUF697 family)